MGGSGGSEQGEFSLFLFLFLLLLLHSCLTFGGGFWANTETRRKDKEDGGVCFFPPSFVSFFLIMLLSARVEMDCRAKSAQDASKIMKI